MTKQHKGAPDASKRPLAVYIHIHTWFLRAGVEHKQLHHTQTQWLSYCVAGRQAQQQYVPLDRNIMR